MSTSAPAAARPVWREPGVPALLAMSAAGFGGYAALLPVAPLWAVHGGAGAAGSGLVNGVLMLFTVLTQLVVPTALRRLGWAPVLVAGMVLLGAPALLHLVTAELSWTLALSAVRGLGFGVLTVCGSAAVAELVEPARRGRAIGVYGLAVAAPQLVLLPAGPWVAQHVGFWVVFAVSAAPLLGVGPAVLLARTLHRLRPADPAHLEDVAHARRTTYRALLPPMALLLAATLAGGSLLTFAPQLSTSAGATMLGLLLLTGTTAVSRWRLGALADRYGARPFLWPLVLLTAAGMALAAWSVRDPDDTAVGALLTAMALVGVGYGGLQNLTLVVAFAVVQRRDYGVASAVWNIGFDAGTGLGSVLVGALASGFSFPVALLVAAAFSLATLPLSLLRTSASRTPS